MKLVLDSNILIDNLRGGNKWGKFFSSVSSDDELYLPTIILFELFSGQSTKRPETVTKILQLLKFINKIELTESIARHAGELYRDTKEKVDLPDYIIAATAIEIGAQVVTLNVKHFSKFSQVAIYELP